MSKSQVRRMKSERPQQLINAAFEIFVEKGVANTRIDDIAKKAGISKGLMYRYFRTKDELFKAVLCDAVSLNLERLKEIQIESDNKIAEIIKGPLLQSLKAMPNTKEYKVINMLLAESHRSNEMCDYYWENMVSQVLEVLSKLIKKGVSTGEFRSTSLDELPQVIVSPVIMAVIWQILFKSQPFHTEQVIDVHVEMLLKYLEE